MLDRDPPNGRLFRYLSLQTPEREGWVRDIFIKHELYFSSPANFNDPFDCKMPPFDSLPKKHREQFTDEFVRQRLATEPRHKRREAKKRLSTKMSFAEIERRTQKKVNDYGVLCLSEPNDDILMWSYYADSHRGICLEFEATRNTPLFGGARSVEYSETYADYPLLGGWSEQMERVLWTKSSHWKYEREWRIVGRSRVAEPILRHTKFLPKHLRGVIFGCQCSPQTVSKVTTWMEEGRCQATRYQAHRKRNEYGLDIRPLS